MSRHPEFEFQRDKLERHMQKMAEKVEAGKAIELKMGEEEFVHAYYLYKGKRPTRKQAQLILTKLRNTRFGTEKVDENAWRVEHPKNLTEAYSMIIRK